MQLAGIDGQLDAVVLSLREFEAKLGVLNGECEGVSSVLVPHSGVLALRSPGIEHVRRWKRL